MSSEEFHGVREYAVVRELHLQSYFTIFLYSHPTDAG